MQMGVCAASSQPKSMVLQKCARIGTPATSYRSQKLPRLEKSKKSLRRSLRGVPADAPKRVRKESPETLRVKNHLFFDSGDSFLTLFGAPAGTPRRLPGDSSGDSFLTFRAGAVFDSCSWSPGSQCSYHWEPYRDISLTSIAILQKI